MLYLKLRAKLTKEVQAMAAVQQFAGMHAVVSPRRIRGPTGDPQSIFAVLVPAGRRPDSVRRQLALIQSHAEWLLVDVDPDGFETEVMPGTPGESVRQ